MAGNNEGGGNDPFHSGHTRVLNPNEDIPGAAAEVAGPEAAAGGQYQKGNFGSATMALAPESLDGYEGVMPGQPPPMAQAGPQPQAPPPQSPGMPGGNDGHTQALSPDQLDGYAGGQSQQQGGGYPQQENYPQQSDYPQQPSSSGGGVPYLETQMIDPSTVSDYQAYPQQQQSPPPSAAAGGGGIPYLETQAVDPSQFSAPQQSAPADPGATVVLDSSSYTGPPSPTAPPPMHAPPPPMNAPPPPMNAPPPMQHDDGMAQGQNTVILQPEQALAALEEVGKLQAVPEHLKGRFIIFVPETDPIMFDLLPGITTVGRGMENHLVLGDPYASRKHMFITNKAGQYAFEDSGSDNGTLVNGQTNSAKTLVTGDVIEIGSVQMRFVQGTIQGIHYQRPQPTDGTSNIAMSGPNQQISRNRRRYSTGQIVLLMCLVLATLGLIAAMIILYLGRT